MLGAGHISSAHGALEQSLPARSGRLGRQFAPSGRMLNSSGVRIPPCWAPTCQTEAEDVTFFLLESRQGNKSRGKGYIHKAPLPTWENRSPEPMYKERGPTAASRSSMPGLLRSIHTVHYFPGPVSMDI